MPILNPYFMSVLVTNTGLKTEKSEHANIVAIFPANIRAILATNFG